MYVGSSCECERRFYVHRYNLRRNEHWSRHLQSAWNKYGAQAFEFKIVEIVDDLNFLLPREQFWIWRTRAHEVGYNTLEIPNRLSGFRHSQESIAKMSASHKGRPSARKGRPLTPEHRAKMVGIGKGRKQSDEWIANAAAKRTGSKRSEETRRRMSEAQQRAVVHRKRTRRVWTEESRRAMSEKQRASWTPERRAAQADRSRLMLAQRTPGQRSESAKGVSPEVRARAAERISRVRELSFTKEARDKHAAKMSAKWADPEYKARVAESMRKNRAKRRAAEGVAA